MFRTTTSVTLLAVLALCACSPTPDPDTTEPTDPVVTSLEGTTGADIGFRARITFDRPAALPAEASIVAYLVKSDLESGARELVTQRSIPVPAESPASVDIDIAREAIDQHMGYEMSATMVDGSEQVIMSTAANRPPVPAIGLRNRNTFDLRMLSVAPQLQPEDIFLLPSPVALTCGALEVDVRQEQEGAVLITLPDTEVRLRPAAASSGGRFANGQFELWVNLSGQYLIMLPNLEPQICLPRAQSNPQ